MGTRDGIEDIGIIILFLPLYLHSASENPVVGTLRGLRILVELLHLLYTRLVDDGGASRSITVDVQSLALFTQNVTSSHIFEHCLDNLRVKEAGGYLSVIVIEEKQGSGDMREQVAQIHRTVKIIASGQSKLDASI